jgi:hypothetical protein
MLPSSNRGVECGEFRVGKLDEVEPGRVIGHTAEGAIRPIGTVETIAIDASMVHSVAG